MEILEDVLTSFLGVNPLASDERYQLMNMAGRAIIYNPGPNTPDLLPLFRGLGDTYCGGDPIGLALTQVARNLVTLQQRHRRRVQDNRARAQANQQARRSNDEHHDSYGYLDRSAPQ